MEIDNPPTLILAPQEEGMGEGEKLF